VVQQQHNKIAPGLPPPLEAAQARSQLYWFLSDFYLTRPETDFVQRLQTQLESATTQSGYDVAVDVDSQRWAAEICATDSALLSSRLLKEYTLLFRGIAEDYPAKPPYESLFLKSMPALEVTASVMQSYQKAEFDMIQDGHPADYIGTELRFLALLCADEYAALINDEMLKAQRRRAEQHALFQKHLLSWVPTYMTATTANCQEPFYQHVLKMTMEALNGDSAYLNAEN
jgi:TorA maturation chaperone TorD